MGKRRDRFSWLGDLYFKDIEINNSNDKSKSLFYCAIIYSWNSIIIKIILNLDVTINVQDNYCKTPLHHSPSYYQNLDSITVLLAHKDIDVNPLISCRWTPFHIAALSRHIEALNLLLENQGIHLNIKNTQDFTPLSFSYVSEYNKHTKK